MKDKVKKKLTNTIKQRDKESKDMSEYRVLGNGKKVLIEESYSRRAASVSGAKESEVRKEEEKAKEVKGVAEERGAVAGEEALTGEKVDVAVEAVLKSAEESEGGESAKEEEVDNDSGVLEAEPYENGHEGEGEDEVGEGEEKPSNVEEARAGVTRGKRRRR